MLWVEGQRKNGRQIANILCILLVYGIVFTVKYSLQISHKILKAGQKERCPALLRSLASHYPECWLTSSAPGWWMPGLESLRHTDCSEAALHISICCFSCQLDLLKAEAVFCGVAVGQTGPLCWTELMGRDKKKKRFSLLVLF